MNRPNDISIVLLECVWMPNGEIIHQGKSLGFYQNENKYAYKAFDRDNLLKLLREGLETSGEHHKQWYLEQITEKLGMVIVTSAEKGIAP